MVEIIHAGAPEWRSETGKPAGSMIAARTPKQAQVRSMAPVFWAMSGS
jgi:hypothetical protein